MEVGDRIRVDTGINGLGTALKILRERRTLSLRELGQLSDVDHAYIHRLEKGNKKSPSLETLAKLLRVLRTNDREAEFLRWLAGHPESDPAVVEYALKDDSIDIEMFTVAASVVHRRTTRPDPAALFKRIRRIFSED